MKGLNTVLNILCVPCEPRYIRQDVLRLFPRSPVPVAILTDSKIARILFGPIAQSVVLRAREFFAGGTKSRIEYCEDSKAKSWVVQRWLKMLSSESEKGRSERRTGEKRENRGLTRVPAHTSECDRCLYPLLLSPTSRIADHTNR